MSGGTRSRTLILLLVVVVAAAAAFLLLRARSNSVSPEAERVQKALLVSGYVAEDPAALPTEPGASARLDVRVNLQRSPGPRQSCVVTVGPTLDEVDVTDCTP